MNEKSKIKRQKRVRKQKILKRDKLQKETKEKIIREKLQYQTRQRGIPIVNNDMLERNIKVLEEALAEHEALLKFREENKDKVAEEFDKIKNEQIEYSEMWKKGENNE